MLGDTAPGGAAGGLVAPSSRQTDPDPGWLQLNIDSELQAIFLELTAAAPEYMSDALLDELIDADARIRRLAAIGRVTRRRELAYMVMSAQRDSTFSLGGDLKLFRDCVSTGNYDALTSYARRACDLIWSMVTGVGGARLTTIGLVRGEAFGGGFEAALATHLLVAERGATFAFPESLFGLYPGMGAEHLITCRTNAALAAQMITDSRIWTAEQLFERGIVDVVVPTGEGRAYVENWMATSTSREHGRLRERFASVTLRCLYDTVDRWVEQAMALDRKHVRAMSYIIQAQDRRSAVTATAHGNTLAKARVPAIAGRD